MARNKRCGHCEVSFTDDRVDREISVLDGQIEFFQCDMCGAVTSFLGGRPRSVTKDGERRQLEVSIV